MAVKSDASHWGSLAKFFHWTMVLLILVQATIGLVMVELPKRPNVIPVYTFHKSLGLTIFAFAVLRLALARCSIRVPRNPRACRAGRSIAARARPCAAVCADLRGAAVGLAVRFGDARCGRCTGSACSRCRA